MVIRLNYDDARRHLSSQMFVEETRDVDFFTFNPYPHDDFLHLHMTALDKILHGMERRKIQLLREEYSGFPELQYLFAGPEPKECTFTIELNGSGNSERDPHVRYLDTLQMTLLPGLSAIMEFDTYLQDPKTFAKLYVDFRLRQDIIQRLAPPYKLLLSRDISKEDSLDSELYVSTHRIESLDDINCMLDFGSRYLQVVHSKNFLETSRRSVLSFNAKMRHYSQKLINGK